MACATDGRISFRMRGLWVTIKRPRTISPRCDCLPSSRPHRLFLPSCICSGASHRAHELNLLPECCKPIPRASASTGPSCARGPGLDDRSFILECHRARHRRSSTDRIQRGPGDDAEGPRRSLPIRGPRILGGVGGTLQRAQAATGGISRFVSETAPGPDEPGGSLAA